MSILLFTSLTDHGLEDMFGADDADWAIYRTIVCVFWGFIGML